MKGRFEFVCYPFNNMLMPPRDTAGADVTKNDFELPVFLVPRTRLGAVVRDWIADTAACWFTGAKKSYSRVRSRRASLVHFSSIISVLVMVCRCSGC